MVCILHVYENHMSYMLIISIITESVEHQSMTHTTVSAQILGDISCPCQCDMDEKLLASGSIRLLKSSFESVF